MTETWHPGEHANQKLWDELAPVHERAYEEVRLVREGQSTLDPHELADLGDVVGRSLLHLMCHIGTDTLSWARLGARVTGVDFSARSLEVARRLQAEVDLPARFIESNVYDLPAHLDERFEIVYTSRGVLCWLKDLRRWGELIARYLAPGGVFYLLELHPICNVFEDTQPGPLQVTRSYFHDPKPTVWDDDFPDYADGEYHPKNPSHEWTWSLSDVLNALIGAGLQIEAVGEYDYLFYPGFPEMAPAGDRTYRFPRYGGKLPLVFTVKARLPAAPAK